MQSPQFALEIKHINFQIIRMSKESKRRKEENERKLKTFENERFSIVS